MPTSAVHNPTLRRVASVLLVILIIGACLGMIGGVTQIASGQVAQGLGLFGVSMVLLAAGVLVYYMLLVALKQASTTYRTYGVMLEAIDELRRQSQYSGTVAENSALSDWAKRIVYREKDREFIRDMVNGAMVRQDWEAAEHLISEMEQELGCHDEAQRLREELEKSRGATASEKLDAALRRFEDLCTAHKWQQARTETERLQALFPEDERIRGLPRELELRRQQRKRGLLRDYDRAVHLEALDQAHQILIELNEYLTPSEVAALKDSARGVFKARLLQMGVQFSIAVSDQKFAEAISVGETIIREFPNSRYAHEIGEMMPALQQRGQQETQPHEQRANA
ncbi:MAG: hypothetical protein JXO22_13725 [Phycisphaerae bacterium]|nr:hypothetical protein [Phycisphaerae bacterium]